ncbi:MAG TPA: hypothetical protein PK165_02655 [bacterium]|nr:hypothetical protein [bacterium]HOL49090.1 hypothetical protein [bacterium]HPO51716.1 hypothetical protein [bacterium]HXK44917.1 hypothetical protein [bacterium]
MKNMVFALGILICFCSIAIAEENMMKTLAIEFEDTLTDTCGHNPVIAKNIKFVEGKTGKGIVLDKDAVLAFETKNLLTSKRGIIDFWFNPYWDGVEKKTRFLMVDDENHFQIMKTEYGTICFRIFTDDWQNGLLLSIPVNNWKQGEWHHIIVDWDIEGETVLKIDQQVSKGWIKSGTSTITLGKTIFFGPSRYANTDSVANGIIDQLMMFGKKNEK